KIDGAQTVPNVTTNASGVATLVLNATRDSLCVNLATTGLSGAITGLHIHEGAPGATGGVVVAFTADVVGNRVNTKIPVTDLDMKKLMDGMYYFNIHTAANAPGEIRGQITLETDWSYWTWLDESYVSSGASGYGIALYNLSRDKQVLEVAVVTYGLTGPITGVHLHSTATGMVAIGLDSLIVDGDQLWGTVDFSGFDMDSLDGGFYLNIHTASNAPGEIAGLTGINKGHYAFDSRLDKGFLGTSSTAKGIAHIEINAEMDTIWYDIAWDTLVGNFTAMHFHAGSGGVMYNMTGDVSGNQCHGMWVSPPDSALDMFIKGSAYINMHSDAMPAGEIAANVIRFAREGYQIHIDAAQTDPQVTSAATGGGLVSINREQTNAHFMMAADNFTGMVTAAHFHMGAAGNSGGVVYPLPWAVGGAYGYWTGSSMTPFTQANSTAFQDGLIYVNIHSDSAASGEARGQVLRDATCFVSLSTDIADVDRFNAGITVFPNPVDAQASVQITLENHFSGSLIVSDMYGRTIFAQNLNLRAGSHRLDLPAQDLAAGMYIVRISAGNSNGTVARTFIKN
ncbi:MAG TPA: CHRD domain-containing protein, partial [Bacteroidetes bacterium]|nr:CHRD domain-containing protein [Bacteroidota bacterium]